MSNKAKKILHKNLRPMSPNMLITNNQDEKRAVRRKASIINHHRSSCSLNMQDDLFWQKPDDLDDLSYIQSSSKSRSKKISGGPVFDCLVAEHSNVFFNMPSIRKNSLPANLDTLQLDGPTKKITLKMLKLRKIESAFDVRSQSISTTNDPHMKAYLFGGCNYTEECYNELFCYEPYSHSLLHLSTKGPKPSNGLRGHCSIIIDTRMYILCGMDQTYYYNDLYVLDIDSLLWQKPQVLGDNLKPRRGSTCCYYKGKIYLFGGGNDQEVFNDLFQLTVDLEGRFKWKKIKYTGAVKNMGYHTATLHGNKWIIYGGTDGKDCFGDIYILDLDIFEWKRIIPEHKLPRMGHSAALFDNKVYMVGGRCSSRYTNTILCIDIESNYSIKVLDYDSKSAVLEPRGYHSCFARGSKLYIMNGYCETRCFDDIHVIELNDKICGI